MPRPSDNAAFKKTIVAGYSEVSPATMLLDAFLFSLILGGLAFY